MRHNEDSPSKIFRYLVTPNDTMFFQHRKNRKTTYSDPNVGLSCHTFALLIGRGQELSEW